MEAASQAGAEAAGEWVEQCIGKGERASTFCCRRTLALVAHAQIVAARSFFIPRRRSLFKGLPITHT